MTNTDALIANLEARHARRPDAKAAIALALRCWVGHAFAGGEEKRTFLQKGYHAALSALRRGEMHLPLLTLTVFVAIEAGHFDSANELLDKALSYKSFLRTNEPRHYDELCYLYAYLEIKQNRIRSARKHWRALRELADPPNSHQRMMLGRLHLATGEYEAAYDMLTAAFAGGCNSPFVYEGLYRCYVNMPIIAGGKTLLPVLCYAAARGAGIDAIAAHSGEALCAAVASDPAGGEKLYRTSGFPPLLKDICARRIREKDYGAESYAYYLAAERKQVFVQGLYTHLVQSAYENDIERVNHYPMQQFLQGAEMETDLAVYVYHLLLTDPSFSDLLPEHTHKILQLAARCLEQGKTGRRANALYYYYWTRCRAMGVISAHLGVAEKIIEIDLTRFELAAAPDSAVRFVYITDSAKRGMDVYEMPENRRLIIEAAGDGIAYTCLGAGRRSVLGEELSVRRMVGGADHEVYRYFFDKGDRRFYLLRYLADYYLENPTPEAVGVLETMLEQKNLVKPYRMNILLTLGKIHFEAGAYSQALECYRAVDETTQNLPRQLLQIYLHTHEFDAAAALIDRKHPYIPVNALLEAIAVLLLHEGCWPHLAGAAHALLLEGYGQDMYEDLLDLALAHFPFSQAELIALSDALAQQEIPIPPALHKRMLEGSLWMATIDPDAQKAFVRLQDEPIAAALIEPYVALCTYHMLTANFRPEYDVLDILEKYYLKSNPPDNLLALALGQVCLRHNITTFHSERIISEALAAQEANGILLPVYKECKPARLPFIEKNHPFLYRGLPGKNVYLYYRIGSEGAFQAKPMEYLRYGMYLTCLPLFYNEEITYYFSEEMPTGSITTREASHKNTTPYVQKEAGTLADPFFTINNAIILEQMFKHDQVEALITGLVKDVTPVRSGIM